MTVEPWIIERMEREERERREREGEQQKRIELPHTRADLPERPPEELGTVVEVDTVRGIAVLDISPASDNTFPL